jgi:outer membrane biosynthesis protein TonB
MGREIKRFIIGALISGGIHLVIFFSPLSTTPTLLVQEIPGSIEISLGAQHQVPLKKRSTQVKETKPLEQEHSSQTEDRNKATEVEDDTSGKSKPDSIGDSTLAIPQEGNPKPPYPEIAYRRGYEGTVRLKVEVLASG